MAAYYPDFESAILSTGQHMQNMSSIVHTERWQGIDIQARPEAKMYELINWDMKVPMVTEDLDLYRNHIRPNLPWADDHFAERVCGFPMNPGKEWANWPWARSAGEFRDEKGRFEINYMERFWAGGEFEDTPEPGKSTSRLTGIRGRQYGDLSNIIQLFVREPLTRQAYLPIYFPEDTGAGGRVPCTLGYHWIMRKSRLHVHYPIRSCDFFRHFRDDIYLAIRLTLWLLEQLRAVDPRWKMVEPGMYSMWIGSLHLFVNDYVHLFKRKRNENQPTSEGHSRNDADGDSSSR